MKVSHLTVAQQCKAFSDAAAYNQHKANIILAKARHRGMTKSERQAYVSHTQYALLFSNECKRLQKNAANIRGV